MAKQSYWLVGGEHDTHALVVGADVRDEYVRDGWTVTEEPTDGWVYIWREDVPEPGRVPVSALRDLWAARGWVAGPPPTGEHPFAVQEPETPAEPAEPKSESAASSGQKKEK